MFENSQLFSFEQTYQKDPMERRGVDGNLWVWEGVDYSKSYMVVADVARGDATDYSAFHIFDIESATQVAEYKGKLSIIDFKTSKKKKPESWIQNYFIQESAYSFMYEERTNIVVPQLVTIIGVDDEPEPQVFVKNAKERNEYLLEFIKLRESFDLSD